MLYGIGLWLVIAGGICLALFVMFWILKLLWWYSEVIIKMFKEGDYTCGTIVSILSVLVLGIILLTIGSCIDNRDINNTHNGLPEDRVLESK